MTAAEIATLTDCVDLAFEVGTPVVIDSLQLVVVPDVVLLEGEANGHHTPRTWAVGRDDGRMAYVYPLPEALR
jgi:hypothetical protein